jgi:hypothetical protein
MIAVIVVVVIVLLTAIDAHHARSFGKQVTVTVEGPEHDRVHALVRNHEGLSVLHPTAVVDPVRCAVDAVARRQLIEPPLMRFVDNDRLPGLLVYPE